MFLIARLLAVFAFVLAWGGIALLVGGLIGALLRFFPLLAMRERLVKSLELEQPELLHHMKESSFFSWMGMHRELIGVPQELVATGSSQLRQDAREYGKAYRAFLLNLRLIGVGIASFLLGGGIAWLAYFLEQY